MKVTLKLESRLRERGTGIFISQHEILGIVYEEMSEYVGAVHKNDHDAQEKELLDIAVAAVWGIVSIRSHKMQW